MSDPQAAAAALPSLNLNQEAAALAAVAATALPSSSEILASGQAVLKDVTSTMGDAFPQQQKLLFDHDDVGVILDLSPWPIVHGTRGSADHTILKQPHGDPHEGFYLYKSQRVQEDEEANGLYMGQLLMQNVGGPLGSRAEGVAGPGFFDEAGAMIDFKVDDANAVSVITERVSDTEMRLWTSTIGNVVVFRQLRGATGLQRLATLNHGRNTRFHGSYAFVASNGTENGFFTTMEDQVVRFVLRGNDKEGWHILQAGEVALPTPMPSLTAVAGGKSEGGDDHLVGLTLLDDGTIITSSKKGVVMAVRLNSQGEVIYKDHLALNPFAQGGPSWVSNSISSTGQSIFVVTHRELMRVDLDPTTHKLSFKWTALYQPDAAAATSWFIGRLGAGSGSTPTITTCEGRQLVVITDGVLPMHLLWYDVATGELAAKRQVQFGPDADGNIPTTSEQSVAVDGCRAFVVQNYMGTDRLNDDIMCASAPRPESRLRRRLAEYCLSRNDAKNPQDLFPTKICPVLFGCSAFGAAVYEIMGPGQKDVARVWAREDVSCGTSIPLLSTHDNSRVAYCVGLKKGSSQWALLGMDLDTGVDRTNLQFYERNLALNALANPFYAGVEATGDNMVTIGSIGGVLHLSPEGNHHAGGLSVLSTEIKGSETAGVAEGGGVGELRLIRDRTGMTVAAEGSMASKLQLAARNTSVETKIIAAVVSTVVVLTVVFRLCKKHVVPSPRMPR